MQRKWHERYPQRFRCRAVERMNACDNIVRLARELRVNRTLLYKWRYRSEERLSEGRRCWNQGSCLQSKCSPN